ncbi:PTS sugar transporter subunit IIA [Anaeropeptidivorans aminofermentans]|uniref:PTS sugar transporter subunit IIA n=1 Tax=Anaeropeptidivorans aminofermentans TaxID=2934315 RepID=UPI0020249BA0|nr:hypothetical protein [Anaeropeptidivorans aminofermentans]
MANIIIATHGRMAEGMKHTLEILTGRGGAVAMNCFCDSINTLDDIKSNIINALNATSEDIIVFTDIKGGSVNRAVSELLPYNSRLHVVSGVNMPLLLEVALGQGETEFVIKHALAAIQKETIYMNELLGGMDI